MDKVFEKIIKIYDESLASDVITMKDYVRMYKEIYDMKIKTKVNDVHRTIKTEDEYLEYSKLVTNFMYDELDTFMYDRAYETSQNEVAKKMIGNALGKVEIEEKVEEVVAEPKVKENKKASLKDKIVKGLKKATKTVKTKTVKVAKTKVEKPKKESKAKKE